MFLNKNSRQNYFLVYSFVFLLCLLGVYFVYYKNGYSLIYNEDGWTQHYKALIYYSRYLKEILHNIINNHKLIIPQWDFSIGEGADIIGTFHYYVIGDPISFFSVFIPEKYIYLFYNCSVILRMYLAGVVFSYLCFYKKHENNNVVLIGSIIYSFCFWNLFNSVRHFYFLNPMILFPLIVIGIEKIIKNESPTFLSIAVLFSSLSNFYFFYIIVILTVIYVATRFLVEYKKDYRRISYKLFEVFKYSLLGTMMSGVILLPIISVFLNDSRSGIEFGKHFLYPLSYYLKLPIVFFSVVNQDWLCIGLAAPVFLAIISSLRSFKKNLSLFVFEILSIIFIVFPTLGQITNGNTYISNKWSFSLPLLFCFVFVEFYERIKENAKVSYILIFGLIGVLNLRGFLINILIPLILCLLYLTVEVCNFNERHKSILLICIIIINIWFNANYFYSNIGANYVSNATTLEQDKNIFNDGETYYVSRFIDSNENDFVRFSGNSLSYNSSILFDKSSTTFFWSLSNPNVTQYRREMSMFEYPIYVYKEFDKRLIPNIISNVKYYVTEKNNNDVPFGYSLIDGNETYDLYKNDNYIPFGFTYEKAINYNQWTSLRTIEKELIMSNHVVLNDAGLSNTSKPNYSFLKYDISFSSNLIYKDGLINVPKEGGEVLLSFKPNQDETTYIEFHGLKYEDKVSWIKRESASKERSNIRIEYNNKSINLALYGENDRMYNGRSNHLINLSQLNENIINIKLVFEKEGHYSLDEILLYSYNPTEYLNIINELKDDCLENITFGTNTISGNIYNKKDEFLFLSIPYSSGWKAFVDGEEKDILKANIAYSAIKMDRGNHHIELKYETPQLKLGATISLVGVILTLLDYIYYKKKL